MSGRAESEAGRVFDVTWRKPGGAVGVGRAPAKSARAAALWVARTQGLPKGRRVVVRIPAYDALERSEWFFRVGYRGFARTAFVVEVRP